MDLLQTQAEFERRFVQCPERSGGEPHVWTSAVVDSARPCKFCGKPGRENFREATAARSELFSRLRAPDSAKGIKPKDKAS